MRVHLFSLGIFLALAMMVVGCGGGDKKEGAGSDSAGAAKTETVVQVTGTTSHPSQEVVMKFLTEVLKDNVNGAIALFTPKAQQEYARTDSSLDPRQFKGMQFRITGGDVLPETNGYVFGIYVDMIDETDPSEPIATVWSVHKIGEEYRIASLMMNLDGEFVLWDFEDPEGTRQAATTPTPQSGVDMQQNVAANPAFQQSMNPQAVNGMSQAPQFNAPQFQQPMVQPQTMNPQTQPQVQPIQMPPQMAQPNAPNFQ